MTTNQNNLNDAFLDDAATAALGAHSVEESDAFTLALAQADEPHRQAARDLRDTVARMAGTAPYLDPPAALRGAILAATAPKTFKMEDYRRTSDVAPKWLRRSLVASIGFLIFAAWYNSNLKTAVDTQNKTIASMTDTMGKAKSQYDQMYHDNQTLVSALSQGQLNLAKATLANPNAPKGIFKDAFGRQRVLVQDPATSQYMILVPEQSVPPGQYAILIGRDAEGKSTEFRALAIGKPDNAPTENFNPTAIASRNVNVQWQGLMTPTNAPTTAGFNPFGTNH